MLWHNRLRHLVNSENQKQIKLDDMHVARDPNNNEMEENIPSTSNAHWQRTQVCSWARPAWTSQHHGLWKGGVSHIQLELMHMSEVWCPGEIPSQSRDASPETKPAFQRWRGFCFVFSLTFSWQTRADTYAPTMLYLYPIKEMPCFCKQYDESCIFNTVICSWELT